MNIFYLDNDPKIAAQYHCDKHVIKMILESGQLLSTAHRVLDPDVSFEDLYKETHVNHPSAIWVRQGVENYQWVYDLMIYLNEEKHFRYGSGDHLTVTKLRDFLKNPPKNIPSGSTELILAMPEQYQTDDPVESYRNYYRESKQHLHHWKKRGEPSWIQN